MDNKLSKIIGIIPARKGSKRLPNKNILPIGDVTLVEHAYRILKKSKCDKVVVATDIEEILKHPDIYSISRPEELNGDDVSVRDVVKFVVEPFYGIGYNVVVVLFATNPLIDYTDINKAIDMLLVNGNDIDIVRSYNIDTHTENGLYVMKIKKAFNGDYDVYTGAIYSAGKEIHTREDWDNFNKRTFGMRFGTKSD